MGMWESEGEGALWLGSEGGWEMVKGVALRRKGGVWMVRKRSVM